MTWNPNADVLNFTEAVKLSEKLGNKHSREWFRRRYNAGELTPVIEHGMRKWFERSALEALLQKGKAKRTANKIQ